jgi:peptide/nickel transport system ATP-binding protein
MSLLEKDTPDVEAGCTVSDLRVALTGRGLDVVDEINIELRPGEVVGLVGESGSGKTTAGTALLAYARRGAFVERGKVMFEGQDVLALSSEQLREIRGMKIAYVPQDPAAALNPAIRIGRQIVELLELHGIGTSEERLDGARAGLREVGLPDDDEFLARYAHQLSGGQVQRVALAMAFLPRPKVLVLDEPTTGLDVTTQGMVLQTLGELCRSHRVASLYVTHDLAVVANIADRVAVMYAGQIIELGPRDAMFRSPHTPTPAPCSTHPAPVAGPRAHRHPRLTPGPGRRRRLPVQHRCAYAQDRCREVEPEDVQVGPDHTPSACASARSAPGTSIAATPPTPTPTSRGTSS